MLRSLLFNLLLAAHTGVGLVVLFPVLALPRLAMQRGIRLWAISAQFLLRWVAGLDFEVRGLDRVPAGSAIFAAKHQSAWDTAVFNLLFDDPRYVIKYELMSIPIWGWLARKSGAIAVNRAGGGAVLKTMAAAAERALAEGGRLVIFPQGTRTQPGHRKRYQPGIAALYAMGRAPVVPVAVNSGLFWGRRRFLKWPGVISVEFLPEMPTGLDRKRFMALLEERIETASRRLQEEALGRFPYLPKPRPEAGSE